jgi:hypothetical protein
LFNSFAPDLIWSSRLGEDYVFVKKRTDNKTKFENIRKFNWRYSSLLQDDISATKRR